jgi:DNA replication protein DnaC
MDKLHALNLMGMAGALSDQLESTEYQTLSFEDRLGLLVDREAQHRENRRFDRNLRAAKLRSTAACVEDIDFRHPRGLDRAQVLSLASAQWVAGHQNVLIVGPTGCGKSYLACALAQAAVRAGHTALYHRVPRLLSDLALARLDGRWPRLLTSLAKIDVLVLDDLALRPLTTDQAADLLEVIEDRNQRRSTIVTSQLPISGWHDALGEPTLADATLDRLLHSAHRLELRGHSLRRALEALPGSLTPADAPSASAEVTPPDQRAPEKAHKAR